MATTLKRMDQKIAEIAGMTVWLRLITPAVAAAMLARNDYNRGQKPVRVKAYTEVMSQGWWDWRTWEPIKVYANGVLADGQHRLAAVVASGVSVEMIVIEGVPLEVGGLLDSGLARSAADVMHMDGTPNANAMAAAVRCVIMAVVVPHMFGASSGGSVKWMSKASIVSVAPRLTGLASTFTLASQVRHLMPASALMASLFLMRRVDAERADWFFARLADGIGLDETSPVRALREYLARAPRHIGTQQERTAKLISAWNAVCEGRSMTRMQYGGKTPLINGLDYAAVTALAPDVLSPRGE